MHWLMKVTVPFVILTVAACGRDESPDSGVVEEAARQPEAPRAGAAAPAADPEPADARPPAKDGKGSSWPALDDDPSLDEPAGSGDWCGTDMRGWRGPGVKPGWSGPDEDGVWRRRTVHLPKLRLDTAAHNRRVREISQRITDAKTPEALAEAQAALAALQDEIRVGWQRFEMAITQFGIEHDGVFTMSEEGESLEDFLARAKKEAAARVAKRKLLLEKKAALKKKAAPK